MAGEGEEGEQGEEGEDDYEEEALEQAPAPAQPVAVYADPGNETESYESGEDMAMDEDDT